MEIQTTIMKNGGNKMNTKAIKEKLQLCIEIVDRIEHYNNMIRCNKETIQILPISENAEEDKLKHQINIYRVFIEHLKEQFLKTITL